MPQILLSCRVNQFCSDKNESTQSITVPILAFQISTCMWGCS